MEEDHNNIHQSFGAIIWMMIVTITSLGFGDIVPHSSPVRILTGIVSVSGVLLAALFVSTTQKFLEVPNKERRLFRAIETSRLAKDKMEKISSGLSKKFEDQGFKFDADL